jgi:hypothetical protein
MILSSVQFSAEAVLKYTLKIRKAEYGSATT